MKTVLFLINGFGVEQKNSYSIYNKELMPNFDSVMNKYMFSSINTTASNLYDAYRNASLGVNEIYNYSLFNKSIKNDTILKNQTLLDLKEQFDKKNGKLHIFCLIDGSEKVVDDLKYLIKHINVNKDQRVYYHLVLTSNNIEDYKNILRVLSKINIELNEYGQIGFVMGLGTISNDNPVTEMTYFYRMFISEVGEKWQSFQQKIDVAYGIKQSPNLIKPFIVNTGFKLEKNDMFMFWNYDRIDLTNFVNLTKGIKYGQELNNISFTSLFEIKSKEKIPYILNYQVSENSLASNLKGLDSKALVIVKKDHINVLNYYLNGLQSLSNPLINYMEFDNYLYKSEELNSVINTNAANLIIINYDINDSKNITELKETLHNIDIVLGSIYENCKLNNYSFIVSSLYGINKVLNNEKGVPCNLAFNTKVPFIFADSNMTKKNYLIESGTTNDIIRVCYKCINSKYQGDIIVTKKNFLYRLLFK